MTRSGRGRPKTQAEFFGEQAYAAWREGQAALGAGRLDEARRWLERARRMAPADATIALSLATVLLRLGDPAAAEIFAEVTHAHDLREAWLGLAAARVMAGEAAGAAMALGNALARHVMPQSTDTDGLAMRICEAAGAPGWCGLRGDAVTIGLAPGGRTAKAVVASLDGKNLDSVPKTPPGTGAMLALTRDDAPLLGSPLDLARCRRLDGFVEAADGGISGWAWHPANPERDPALRVRGARGTKTIRLVATDDDMSTDRPLARPRRFSLAAGALAGLVAPLRVTGGDGRDLPGSPLDPGAPAAAAIAVAHALAAARPARARLKRRDAAPGWRADALAVPAYISGPPARAPRAPTRRLAVVVPVYRDAALTLACLAAVRETMPARTTLIVVDDATPEPDLSAALDDLARRGAITLLRHTANTGFPAAANTGLAAAAALSGGPDVVLLNSDALVTAGALAALRALMHGAPDIGTATPLSNDATILSYPDRAGGNAMPDNAELERLGRLAARANAGVAIDIPTAVGFCMVIRRECLLATGLFRDDVFAQGYGEENDFCIRARHLGWRHVAAPGVYVGHAGGTSFAALGAARQALIARNLALLERLHPGYHDLVAAHERDDPLAEARRRLDAARFARRPARGATRSAILVTHDSGGGVERVVRGRCEALRRDGIRPIVLRPVRDPEATSDDEKTHLPGLCAVFDGVARDTPNLRFHLPGELQSLVGLLRAERPAFLELHHLLGHDRSVVDLARRLKIPWDVHIHDYAWFCPRIALVGATNRYCGEPVDPADCEACIADAGRGDEQDLPVAALRARSADDLAGARRVTAPSADAATRIRRHFPRVRPDIVALEDDTTLPPARALRALSARGESRRRVCVIGGVGVEKGYDVLLACARDAAARQLPLEFVVIGHTIDDARMFATGRVFVTGPYREERALEEIAAQSPDLAFLPSIWPETWCYTLGHAWRAGLHVIAFDIGAPAERIGRTGRGRVIPLGLPPASVNDVLLATRVEARR